MRPRCAHCLRPARTCICHWLRATPNEVEVLILQHPLEADQAKGSARLLHLSLQHSRLEVGETFADEALAAWLGPNDGTNSGPNSDMTALLYPVTESAPGPLADPAQPPRRLVVLDATWRKSLRMLCLNPRLLALPRWPLRDPPASAYAALRRAHRPDQLSTLEATCLALQQLEPAGAARYEPLLEAFGGFVAEAAGRVPGVG